MNDIFLFLNLLLIDFFYLSNFNKVNFGIFFNKHNKIDILVNIIFSIQI